MQSIPLTNIWKAKDNDGNEDVKNVIYSQSKHQLVKVPLDLLSGEPDDTEAVAKNTKYADQNLTKKMEPS